MRFIGGTVLSSDMPETPFEQIQKHASGFLSESLVKNLPRKWEKIGDVLLLKIPEELSGYAEQVAQLYADVLDCKSVLQDVGGISGVYREPQVVLLYGLPDTETVHVENTVRYKLNPKRVMFSSGNMDERIRMGRVVSDGEVVVDLFAGIGYFSLPIAVHSSPQRVFSCEMNPVAFEYLKENIVLNDVTHLIRPVFGDNRKTAPQGVADRVIMGYLKDTWQYLPVAFNCLKDNKGILHYHETGAVGNIVKQSCKRLDRFAQKKNRKITRVKSHIIKSYAPGVSHVVLDVMINE